MIRTANNSFSDQVGVICVENINFTSKPYMYFLEQDNVDDDATFITIFLVSFILQSYFLMQSAVCSLQMSYTTLEPNLRFFNHFRSITITSIVLSTSKELCHEILSKFQQWEPPPIQS